MRLTPPSHNAFYVSAVLFAAAVGSVWMTPTLAAWYGIAAAGNLLAACYFKKY